MMQDPTVQHPALRDAELAVATARAALLPLYQQHAEDTARKKRRWNDERELGCVWSAMYAHPAGINAVAHAAAPLRNHALSNQAAPPNHPKNKQVPCSSPT